MKNTTTATNYNDNDSTYAPSIVNEINKIKVGTAAAVNRTHDAFGNLTDDGNAYKFVWDFKDRLAKLTDRSDVTIATYKTDAMNRRVQKALAAEAGTSSSVGTGSLTDTSKGWTPNEHQNRWVADSAGAYYKITSNTGTVLTLDTADTPASGPYQIVEVPTQYIYDGWQVIEERDATGTLIAEYAYGNGIDEPIIMRRLDTADVDGDSNTSEWMEYFYHQNGANNVTFITLGNCAYATAAAGDVIEKYEYDLYGATTKLTWWDPAANGGNGAFVDKTANGTQIANPYLFQGRRYDPESDLYYFRNRYYDPAAGRFISRDPAGFIDGPNLYAFVNNSPINFTDPMGLKTAHEERVAALQKAADHLPEWIDMRRTRAGVGDITLITPAGRNQTLIQLRVQLKRENIRHHAMNQVLQALRTVRQGIRAGEIRALYDSGDLTLDGPSTSKFWMGRAYANRKRWGEDALGLTLVGTGEIDVDFDGIMDLYARLRLGHKNMKNHYLTFKDPSEMLGFTQLLETVLHEKLHLEGMNHVAIGVETEKLWKNVLPPFQAAEIAASKAYFTNFYEKLDRNKNQPNSAFSLAVKEWERTHYPVPDRDPTGAYASAPWLDTYGGVDGTLRARRQAVESLIRRAQQLANGGEDD